MRASLAGAILMAAIVSGFAATAWGAGGTAAAGAGAAGGSLVYSNILVGRVNPLGVKDDFKLMLRIPISRSDHLLLKDSNLSVGLVSSLKPTATQVGFGVDLQPLAVLRLSASVEWVELFEPFDNLLSFASPRADHSDGERERLGISGQNYSTRGVYVSLGAMLQAKVRWFAVRSDLKLVYADLALRGGDTVFYEIEWDLLAQDGGWVLFDNTDVLFMADFGLIAGVRYSLAHALYTRGAYGAGESTKNPNTPVHKLGIVLGWSFKDVVPGFQKPTILLMGSWYLEHRYRAGQETSQGMPCIILAFAFNGRLL